MNLLDDTGTREEIWQCKVGGTISRPIRPGGDWPMRQAVEKAFFELTGEYPEFHFSGWNAELSVHERDVVNSHKPKGF